MYKFVNVCVFCSQLFDEDYKISSKPEELLDLPQKKEPVVKTELLRMNIASGQKCYMSSVVDSLTADKALTRSVSINGNYFFISYIFACDSMIYKHELTSYHVMEYRNHRSKVKKRSRSLVGGGFG